MPTGDVARTGLRASVVGHLFHVITSVSGRVDCTCGVSEGWTVYDEAAALVRYQEWLERHKHCRDYPEETPDDAVRRCPGTHRPHWGIDG